MTEHKAASKTTNNFSIEDVCHSSNLLNNLREVVDSHPNKCAKNLGMSIIHLIEGDHDKTLDYLKIIAEENPNISLIQVRIAQIYISKSEYQKAIDYLEKALKSDEENLTAMIWLGLCYYVTGNGEKARASFDCLKDNVFFLDATASNWT